MPLRIRRFVAVPAVCLLLAATGCSRAGQDQAGSPAAALPEKAFLKTGQAGGAMIPNALPGSYDKPATATVAGSALNTNEYQRRQSAGY